MTRIPFTVTVLKLESTTVGIAERKCIPGGLVTVIAGASEMVMG